VVPLEAVRDPSTVLSQQSIIVRKLSNIRYWVFIVVYQTVPYISEDHTNNLLNIYTLFIETFISTLII